ncbi:MAG: hypothetical protein E6J91_18670 [Deltaproteobacteria bacterium]|nr:MAG: hypothetical protein E6J91_18670 [Deltaproteobacteria bacterium]
MRHARRSAQRPQHFGFHVAACGLDPGPRVALGLDERDVVDLIRAPRFDVAPYLREESCCCTRHLFTLFVAALVGGHDDMHCVFMARIAS